MNDAATPTDSGSKPDPVMAILSYFGIFALIPFLMKKDDAVIQWHSKQGLFLFLAFLIVGVGLAIVGMFVPFVGILSLVINLVYLALMIFCIVKAIGGSRYEVPVIADKAGPFPG